MNTGSAVDSLKHTYTYGKAWKSTFRRFLLALIGTFERHRSALFACATAHLGRTKNSRSGFARSRKSQNSVASWRRTSGRGRICITPVLCRQRQSNLTTLASRPCFFEAEGRVGQLERFPEGKDSGGISRRSPLPSWSNVSLGQSAYLHSYGVLVETAGKAKPRKVTLD
jgi:hypothetical protein